MNMKCPKCKGKTYVTKTFFKDNKTIRYRKCSECKHTFQSTEMETSGWEYKNIVNKIKEILREVK